MNMDIQITDLAKQKVKKEWWQSVDTSVLWLIRQIRMANQLSAATHQISEHELSKQNKQNLLLTMPMANVVMDVTSLGISARKYISLKQKQAHHHLDFAVKLSTTLLYITSSMLRIISVLTMLSSTVLLFSSAIAITASLISFIGTCISMHHLIENCKSHPNKDDQLIGIEQNIFSKIITIFSGLLGFLALAVGLSYEPSSIAALSITLISTSVTIAQSTWTTLPNHAKWSIKSMAGFGKESYKPTANESLTSDQTFFSSEQKSSYKNGDTEIRCGRVPHVVIKDFSTP